MEDKTIMCKMAGCSRGSDEATNLESTKNGTGKEGSQIQGIAMRQRYPGGARTLTSAHPTTFRLVCMVNLREVQD